jgi:hypothetical protein
MFDFAQNREVQDLAAVPETFRGFYKEKGEGGGFALDTENPVVRGSVEVIAGLNTALGNARRDLDAAKGAKIDLSPLKDFGDDPASIKTTVETKLQELQRQIKNGADIEKQLDSQRTEMTSSFEKEKQTLAARIEALQAQLYTQLIDGETLSSVGDSMENPRLLLPFVRSQVRPVEADGKIAVRVIKAGTQDEIRMSGTTGLPMTVEELVAEMRGSKEYAALFKSEARQGSGHRPGTGGGGGVRSSADMTAAQKIAAGLPGLQRS